MPLIDEQFGAHEIKMTSIAAGEEGPNSPAYIMLIFCVGQSGVRGPDGPDPLITKRVRLDAATAVQIGQGLLDEGKRIGGSGLAIATSPAQAEREAKMQGALRNGS